LAHQGDVYSASFAAVPHVVQVLSAGPAEADESFFHFPAWVEVCRQRKGAQIPGDLAPAYFDALRRFPSLVAAAASRDWDVGFLSGALGAVAASKGFGTIAEVILELNPEVAKEFMEWFSGL
jgi:hypothetical protein